MKNFLIILIVMLLVFILSPMRVSAFSFVDVFKILNRARNVEIEEVDKLPSSEEDLTEKKYKDWKDAYNNYEIEDLFLNPDNFVFTEAEINYLITKRLGDMNYPPVQNVKIYLKNGLIQLRGESIKKFFKGKIELDIAPVQRNNKFALEVKKAKFKGIYFPRFIASYIIKEEMKETYAFLYSHEEYKKLKVEATENKLELKYSKE